MWSRSLMLVLAVGIQAPLHGQDVADLHQDQVVRWREGRTWRQGTLIASPTRDGPLRVSLARKGDTLTVSRDATGLAVMTRASRKSSGRFLGAVVGLVIGGGIGLAQGDDPPGWISFSAQEKAVALGMTGASLGFLIGWIAAPGAEWRAIGPTGEQSRLGVAVRARSAGLRFRF